MRILITADPYLPVPPRHYGGIERVIALLADTLAARGHDVLLAAHPASTTRARLIPYGVPPHRGRVARFRELVQLAGAVARRARWVDVVHSFGRLAALAPVLPLRSVAKVQTYQRAIPWRGVRRARRLADGSLLFTACSRAMYSGGPGDQAGAWRTVHNAVDLTRFTPVARVADDAPLVFLGRLERIKGVHHAIAIARRAGRRLVIAGNRVENPDDPAYFDAEIAPHLDGGRVEYVGEIDDDAKNGLLGRAAALLMPVEWEEPFGIVMAEALACGTPVIGFARGAVPEVVRDGETGFVCRSPDEAVEAVGRIGTVDRARCRADAERRFSAGALADGYERVYAELLA